MGWNYSSISKLQRCNRWSFGMDKWFRPTFYWACDYLSMLGLKLNHVNKRGPWSLASDINLSSHLGCASPTFVRVASLVLVVRLLQCQGGNPNGYVQNWPISSYNKTQWSVNPVHIFGGCFTLEKQGFELKLMVVQLSKLCFQYLRIIQV